MKNRISQFALVILATVSALAFNGEDETVFYLQTNDTFRPGEKVTIMIGGRLSSSIDVDFALYEIVDPIRFFNEQQNPHQPGIEIDDEGTSSITVNLHDRTQFKPVETWSERVAARNYWTRKEITVPTSEAGVYFVTAESDEKIAGTAVIVSDAALVVKRANDRVLAYAQMATDGQRLANTDLVFRNGSTIRETKTDVSGVAQVAMELMEEDEEDDDVRRYYGSQFVVYGESNGNFFISDSYYHWRWYSGSEADYRTYLHTDRPVYRPGQTVHYRGIVREVNSDGTYSLAGAGDVHVVIRDSRGDEIDHDTVALSAFGTYHGDVSLADEPPLGNYTISATLNQVSAGNYSFSVEEYKKPEYEVAVNTPKSSYTRGETIPVMVQADYYFGAPVTNAQVEYRVLRSRYWRPWWTGTQWAGYYRGLSIESPYSSEFVERGEGTLDEHGRMSFDIEIPNDLDGDYNFSIVANVTDASRRTISGSSTVRVTRGAFYLTARTDRYVYKPGEKASITVGAYRFDGSTPVQTDFSVSVKRRGRSGSYEDVEVYGTTARTGSDGTRVISFPVDQAGYYTASIETTDDRGNKITTSESVYVADRTYSWWDDDRRSVEIIPDREVYEPGDKLTALVILPVDSRDLLVAQEGPTLFGYEVVRMNGRSAIIEVDIIDRFSPSFTLTAGTIIGDAYYSARRDITVAATNKLATIEISPNKDEYEPGESGTVTVRALNHENEPIRDFDLAIGIVDEAIYAIKPDNVPSIESAFYGQRWNEVRTATSLSFRFYGQSVAVADNALAPADRSEMVNAGPVQLQSASTAKLAAGAAMDGADPVKVRTDFRDVMYWTPSVRTDASGYARLDVQFPENLTTWRITARGITQDTRVGQGTAEVIVTKDLLVRMETPRFITAGDRLQIATTIHNYLDQDASVQVQFDADGVKQSNDAKVVSIPANGEERIDWDIVAESAGEATLTVTARSNQASDGMELTVPVLPQGVKTGTSEMIDISEHTGSRSVELQIPDNANFETAKLVVSASPSTASSILGALDELIGYPYGCVEQTMSRFLPTVVVANVLEDLHVPFDRERREELPKMVEQGVKRLYTLQHDDGGWGWWENDDTNPFMTAYVMYGFTVARKAGYEIVDERYDHGSEVLVRMIEQQIAGGSLSSDDDVLNPTTEAYMLYVASQIDDVRENEGIVRERISNLVDRDDVNDYGVALLALAAHTQGMGDLSDDLVSRLEGNAKSTAAGVYWTGSAWHYSWTEDKVETSAAAVKAIMAVRGETEQVRKGVRWLLSQKHGTSWHNTRQTSMVIYSLVDYLQVTSELDPDYKLSVSVNGKEVMRRNVRASDVFQPEMTVQLDNTMLRRGTNRVVIKKDGVGRVYAAARMTYYATGSALKQASAGISVSKEYFRLTREKTGDKYVYTKSRLASPLTSGDEFFVRVTVTPDQAYEYFMLEDPLPAGCEVVTDTDGYEIEGESEYSGETRPYYYRRWNYWYADRDVRDEKIAFFATSIGAETYSFTYIVRAQIPGSYSVMPAQASLMYYPEVRGNSASRSITIVDR